MATRLGGHRAAAGVEGGLGTEAHAWHAWGHGARAPTPGPAMPRPHWPHWPGASRVAHVAVFVCGLRASAAAPAAGSSSQAGPQPEGPRRRALSA